MSPLPCSSASLPGRLRLVGLACSLLAFGSCQTFQDAAATYINGGSSAPAPAPQPAPQNVAPVEPTAPVYGQPQPAGAPRGGNLGMLTGPGRNGALFGQGGLPLFGLGAMMSMASLGTYGYVPDASLMLQFGAPTHGTDTDVVGAWKIDARRSAAIWRAFFTHLYRAQGVHQIPDMSKMEQQLAASGMRLELLADRSYRFTARSNDGRVETPLMGRWTFLDGVLSLGGLADVEGIPVQSAPGFQFSYYRNEKFNGLVITNHVFGLVLERE